ncbi:tetratricopeptide repeat protein [Epilithonimonas zeae]|uniref:Tetratricopeptide repeat protein n=1 Tax=Epilithonimonas zeae TaxID=1416779 RepID=A0A1N6GSX1_9FLAO|nr:hypothetical protein [Epilithonimonas zeae]SIO10598.1 hypothetical protein SAMN05444409_2030 [Epilithonimonas zeae]
MNKNFNRRKFLEISSLCFAGTVIPVNFLFSSNRNSKVFSHSIYDSLREAKISIRKKEYSKAEEIYSNCIAENSNYLSAYDGLQNLYSITKKSDEDIIALYMTGLKKNPKNPYFYERIGKWYMRLEIGNKKQARLYQQKYGFKSLLEESLRYILRANELKNRKDSTVDYFLISLEKINRIIEFNSIEPKKQMFERFKSYKAENRQKYKSRYQNWSREELLRQFDDIGKRNSLSLYSEEDIQRRKANISKEKLSVLNHLINKRENNNIDENLINITKEIYYSDSSNTQTLGLLKKVLDINKSYHALISIQEENFNNNSKINIWNKLAYIRTFRKAYKEDRSVSLDGVIRLNEELYELDVIPLLKLPIIDSLSSLHCLLKDFEKARDVCYRFTDENTAGSTYGHLILYISRSYFDQGDYFYCIELLNSMLNKIPSKLKEKDEILIVNYSKLFNGKIDRGVYYLLGKSYEAINDNKGLDNVVKLLSRLDPKDSFVRKRMKI